jgi:hypothetical protein
MIAAHFLARDKGFCWGLPRMLWDWRDAVCARRQLGAQFPTWCQTNYFRWWRWWPPKKKKKNKKLSSTMCSWRSSPVLRFEIAPSVRPSVHPSYLGSFDTNYIIILKILKFSTPQKKHSRSKILCRKIENNVLDFLQYFIFNMQSSN